MGAIAFSATVVFHGDQADAIKDPISPTDPL